jgi:potassium efflux system protein
VTEAGLVPSALAGAAAAHLVLHRARRRLPLVLTRVLHTPGASHPDPALVDLVRRVVGPVVFVLWASVVWWLPLHVKALQWVRDEIIANLLMALTTPLFAMNDHGYTAVDLLLLPALLGLVWVSVGAVTRLAATRLRSNGAEHGRRESVLLLVRYAVTLVAGLIVLQSWGIDVRTLAIVGSVLGVGIGFGLQNLANNFVSGIVLSLERPIRPGDYVRIGDFQGTVERIGARSTLIVTRDRVSILVPNAMLLEREVVNWTHGDPICRVSVPVGIAYGSDLAVADRALMDATARHPDVLPEPRPRVEFRAFGDSALELEVEVFTREPARQMDLVSDLNFRIDAALRQAGITVPFPQRDLHLKSPEVATLVEALARRSFSDEERGAAEAALAARSAPAPMPMPVAAKRSWDEAAIGALVERMRGQGGVEIEDRRHLLRTYPRCFVGRQAVDWLCGHEGLSRTEAVDLGQRLVERGVLHHVLDEHPFRDGTFYYRFRADEAA